MAPRYLDLRFGGTPLFGRLRGVTHRGELRPTIMDQNTIFAKVEDPHFVARGALPDTLPPVISNDEHQIVVQDGVLEALKAVVPDLESFEVRLESADGTDLGIPAHFVPVASVRQALGQESHAFLPGGYFYASYDDLNEREDDGDGDLPPIFRARYTLLVGVDDAVGAVFAANGLTPVDLPTLSGPPFRPERADTGYRVFRAGLEGARLELASESPDRRAFQTGESVASGWPDDAVAQMTGRKSQKKIVDFMKLPGATVSTKKARAVLEPLLDGCAELLDVAVHKHDGSPSRGTFAVLHVTEVRDVVHPESDIEITHDKVWKLLELVFDPEGATDRPAFFRPVNTRYTWVFVREDVAQALEAAKLKGFGTRSVDSWRWPVESGVPTL